ncbi:MAG: thioredoxin-disulfide reductase [Treponema sp.]|nr:thioredoxin-disulfide reductase [Treponema sp.]
MQKDFSDFVVVGAGAAGLTAAQYGARSGLDTLLIDSSDAGGQALNIFTLENFPGFFPAVKGRTFIDNMQAQAQSFGAEIALARVKSIDKIKNQFIIKTDKGSVSCYTVLIATGAEHRKLGAKGESEFNGRGVSYCATCDGPFFRGGKIFVVGGGDSALEEAFYLSSLSDQVILVHRRDQFRAQKAIQQKIKKNKNITVIFNTEIAEIKGGQKVESVVLRDTVSGEKVEQTADAVFIFVGMNPRTDLVSMLRKDEGGYLITNYRMETSVPGMYAAGDVRAKPFRQLITAASDGAIAAHQAHEYVTMIKNARTGAEN